MMKLKDQCQFHSLYPLKDFSERILNQLPELNKNSNKDGIHHLVEILPCVDAMVDIAYNAPYAIRVRAMGDLGFLLVSSIKAGLEESAIGSLIEGLNLFSHTTGLVPRDTYSSYVVYNSPDALRTFTGDESEIAFIRQHQSSDAAIRNVARDILELQMNPLCPERLIILEKIYVAIDVFKTENTRMHKMVDPKFFIRYFRDYFFPIKVNGVSLNAPSGVHVANLITIDIASGVADQDYKQTTLELLGYLEPRDKWSILKSIKFPCLIEVYGDNAVHFQDELKLLKQIADRLEVYRLAHQGLVTRYIRRQDSSITVGTGGFPFDTFLQSRVDMSRKASTQITSLNDVKGEI